MLERGTIRAGEGEWRVVQGRRRSARGRQYTQATQEVVENRAWLRKDERNVTTFYFSRFPDTHEEKRMRKIFQRYGKVWDVFIPKRRNRARNHFGFVHFLNVQDKTLLDQILIGSKKLANCEC